MSFSADLRRTVFPSRQIDAIARTIDTQEIVRPSERITGAGAGSVARARGTAPDKLRRVLRGDLDNIALCALQKEPGRRYRSAERFADDVRRHKGNMPVSARADTLEYRVRKFISRHRWAVAASAVALVAILAGSSVAIWQARVASRERDRAVRRFNDVRNLASSLIFEINDAVEPLAGSTQARKLIADRALTYLNRLSADAGNDVALERDLAAGYEQLAYTQGNWLQANLGQTNSAVESYRRAARIREAILAARPDDSDAKLDLSSDYGNIALFAGSQDYWRKALQIREELAARYPSNYKYLFALGSSYERDGMMRSDRNDMEGALPSFEKALGLYSKALQAKPENTLYQRAVSYSHKHIGSVLAVNGNFAGALEHASKALAMDQRLCAANPDNGVFRYELTYSYMDMGDLLSKEDDLDGALDSYMKAMSIRKALADADSNDARAREGLSDAQYSIGVTLASKGNRHEAADWFRKSLSIREQLAVEDPHLTRYQLHAAQVRFQLAKLDMELGNDSKLAASKRRELLREASDLLERARTAFQRAEAATLTNEDRTNMSSIPQMIKRCGRAIADLT
jgi:non-specific serine/threonine protein kinase/serine/threonine-protein kinase